jgi:hypothetical protein
MNFVLSFLSPNWLAGLFLQLISSDLFQSLERKALAGLAGWFIHIGVSSADANAALTSIIAGVTTLLVSLFASLRNNASSTASTTNAPAAPTN